jgi:hypothetical protein
VKVCDKTCILFFFPIINKNFLMAKRSLLSRCPSYLYHVSNTLKLSNYNSNIYVYDMYIKRLTNPMLLCNLMEEIND